MNKKLSVQVINDLKWYNATRLLTGIGWGIFLTFLLLVVLDLIFNYYPMDSSVIPAILSFLAIAVLLTLPHIYPFLKFRNYKKQIKTNSELQASVLDYLTDMINQHKYGIMCSYIENLYVLGDERKIDMLIEILSNKKANAKVEAIRCLMLSKDPRAIEPIKNALNDPSKKVREKADIAYKGFTR